MQNILVTGAGHIKLTDLGGTRAYTESALNLLQDSRGLLSKLRSGDWKDVNDAAAKSESIGAFIASSDSAAADDSRCGWLQIVLTWLQS